MFQTRSTTFLRNFLFSLLNASWFEHRKTSAPSASGFLKSHFLSSLPSFKTVFFVFWMFFFCIYFPSSVVEYLSISLMFLKSVICAYELWCPRGQNRLQSNFLYVVEDICLFRVPFLVSCFSCFACVLMSSLMWLCSFGAVSIFSLSWIDKLGCAPASQFFYLSWLYFLRSCQRSPRLSLTDL